MPGSNMPYAAEAPTRRASVRLEHRLDGVAEPEVHVPDNPGADAAWPVEPAGTHGRRSIEELGLTERP